MSGVMSAAAMEQVFTTARTYTRFTDRPVTDDVIAQLYDLLKWGPTSMNCQPGHYLVIRSAEAKQRLDPVLVPGNRDKAMKAPATVIVATDTEFYRHLDTQFPVNPKARAMFESNEQLCRDTAFRNSSLQGAYLIIAARMLGLDCGPMSGFDNSALDAEFFPEGRFQSNLLVNIGYGVPGSPHPRGPRLAFDEAVKIL
jgi:3-hydroxypropanoate dehydrogenase